MRTRLVKKAREGVGKEPLTFSLARSLAPKFPSPSDSNACHAGHADYSKETCLLSYSKPYRESARKNVLRGTLRSTDQSLGGFGRARKQAKMGAVKLRGDWGGSNEKPLRRLTLVSDSPFQILSPRSFTL